MKFPKRRQPLPQADLTLFPRRLQRTKHTARAMSLTDKRASKLKRVADTRTELHQINRKEVGI